MPVNAKTELDALRSEAGFAWSEYCTPVEVKQLQNMIDWNIPLPRNVILQNGAYIKYLDSGLTHEEKLEYLALKRGKYIRTIKNCVLFFTVLTVIGLVAAFIILSNALRMFRW